MPSKIWAVGEEVLAADFNAYVQQQVVATFPNAAARSAAIAAPAAGMVTYRDDAKVLEYWTGAAWVPVQPVYNDTGTLGAARIRAGSRLGATDVGGGITIALSPPLGTVVSYQGVMGDNLTAVVWKPNAPGFVAGSTSTLWIAVHPGTDAPLANATTRLNWMIIDRLA